MLAVATCTLLTSSTVALGKTASNTMHVTLNVESSCTFTADDMDFGTHSTNTTTPLKSNTSLHVICSKGTPYVVGLTTTTLELADNATSKVPYKLYSDSANANEFTSLKPMTSATGTGNADDIKLYGVIAANALASVPVGTYTQDVSLSVTY